MLGNLQMQLLTLHAIGMSLLLILAAQILFLGSSSTVVLHFMALRSSSTICGTTSGYCIECYHLSRKSGTTTATEALSFPDMYTMLQASVAARLQTT